MKKHVIIYGRIRDGKYCRLIYRVVEKDGENEHIFEQAICDENVLKRGLQMSMITANWFIKSNRVIREWGQVD